MVTFGLNYDVRPGEEERFEQHMQRVLTVLPAVPGHRASRLYREVGRPAAYLIYSEWETREDLMRFTGSPAFREAVELGREILQGPPRHRVYMQAPAAASPAG